jgi:DNA-binding NarL/FixJ family response regulator
VSTIYPGGAHSGSPAPEPRDESTLRRPNGPTSVLIADSLALVCDGLASLCQQAGDFEIVARCQDGLDAWQKIERLVPAVALLDLALPRLFPGEILRRCRAASLPTRCAIVAPRSDRKAVVEALRSGAQAYILKTDPGSYLIDALRQIRSGGVYVSPTLPIQSLFISKKGQSAHLDPFESLSSREHQVFTLLVAGYRAKEIAATLDLSPKTIDTYRSNLMRKLDIRDVASLVKFAMQHNLTEAP